MNTFAQQQTSKSMMILTIHISSYPVTRFGSDVTRAILKCEGIGGVQYGTLQPQSLEKLKNLEKGIKTPKGVIHFVCF